MAEVRCQQPETGVIKAGDDLSETKTCCGCQRTFTVDQFPSKGKGRRKSKCRDCDNQLRRKVYGEKSKQVRDERITVQLAEIKFNEGDVAFNQISDLIADSIMNEVGDG